MLRVILEAAESSAFNSHFSQEYAFPFDKGGNLTEQQLNTQCKQEGG